MNDVLGRRIGEGDIVAYPVRRGSNMWMAVAVVTGVEAEQIQVRKLDGRGRVTYVEASERLALLLRSDDSKAVLRSIEIYQGEDTKYGD